MFLKDEVEFRVVVEPQEFDAYAEIAGAERVLTLPKSNGGLVFARNWIRDHAVSEGHERHWQFDDDIRYMVKMHHGWRIACDCRIALIAMEDFVDRYENVGLSSFNSSFFLPGARGSSQQKHPPFYLNHRCYTCFLMKNDLPYRWRYRYNEDTDMTLQVLMGGWCTILFNVFMIVTPTTMTRKGGQMDVYVNDGRLRMARELERVWPGVVKTTRRFRRPQHAIFGNWQKFDNQLVRKADVEIPTEPNEYGLKLVTKAAIQNEQLQQMVEEHGISSDDTE